MEEAKKPRISHDNDGGDGEEMEDVASSANTAGATTTTPVDGSTTIPLLLVSTTAVADREIVRRLHPIVYKVEPYEDTETLCRDLAGIQFLQPIDASAQDILDHLETIYRNARGREARKVEGGNNVPTDVRIAAIEIRHAILHCELQTIDGGTRIYSERVADLQNPGTVEIVVVRREDREFWDRCIAVNENNPVCGVGNPGIGKTTTTIFLLQRLMNQNKPVVYTIRKRLTEVRRDDIFYEFVPEMDKEQKLKDVTVKVYKMPHEDIYNLPVLRQ